MAALLSVCLSGGPWLSGPKIIYVNKLGLTGKAASSLSPSHRKVVARRKEERVSWKPPFSVFPPLSPV